MTSRFFILLFLPSFAISQNKVTENEYKNNGDPKRLTFYNKDSLLWTVTEYNLNGTIRGIFYYDSTGYLNHRQFTRFDDQGRIAYILNFNHGNLNGKVYQFYSDGSIRLEGQFFNHYKTGEWQEFYPNRQLKSRKKYILSNADSTSQGFWLSTGTEREEDLTLWFGDLNTQTLIDSARKNPEVIIDDFYYLATRDVYACKSGHKVGTWYYYDINGALIKKEFYKAGKLLKK